MEKRTMSVGAIKMMFKRIIDSKVYYNGFTRFSCLAVIDPPKLIDFYFGFTELEEDELARLEEALTNDKLGE